jgi:adenylate cyclase
VRALIDLLQRLFLFGRGRPVALGILLWMTTLSVLSEMPDKRALEQISGSVLRPFSSARQFLFDGYQKYYPREPLSQPVTIVEIDEVSLAQLGQWPWPRNILAELVDAIAAHQPAAIGFDMYMPEPDQTSPTQMADNLPPETAAALVEQLRKLPGHDARLAQSLHKTPSVLGAAGFDFSTQTSSVGLRTAPLKVNGGDALPFVRRFEAVLASLPELQAAAWGQAILSVDLEFGVVRRIPLVAAVGDELVSGLAMEMLRIATNSSAVELAVDGHGISRVSVADLDVPTQAAGEIWLHYARSEATAGRYVSAADVLSGEVDGQQLSGKLVLIGLTGSGLHDMRTTALRELVPGIEIQAQVLETLFDGRFLLRPWWIKWLETTAIVLLGGLMIWFFPRTNSTLARFLKTVPRASLWMALALNAVLIGSGYLLFRYYGLLFDASSFFLVLSGTMGSLVSSAMIEIDREAREHSEKHQHHRELAQQFAGKLLAAMERAESPGLDEQHNYIRRMTRDLAQMLAQQGKFSASLSAPVIEALCTVVPLRDFGLGPTSVLQLSNSRGQNPEALEAMALQCELGHIALAAVGDSPWGCNPEAEDNVYLNTFSQLLKGQFECWNGEGYPRGTAGDAIPLVARIVALVDAYEVLVYGWEALTHDQAVARIRSASGVQFDPEIVDIFGLL